jgi:hypothetical protein
MGKDMQHDSEKRNGCGLWMGKPDGKRPIARPGRSRLVNNMIGCGDI